MEQHRSVNRTTMNVCAILACTYVPWVCGNDMLSAREKTSEESEHLDLLTIKNMIWTISGLEGSTKAENRQFFTFIKNGILTKFVQLFPFSTKKWVELYDLYPAWTWGAEMKGPCLKQESILTVIARGGSRSRNSVRKGGQNGRKNNLVTLYTL